MKNFLLGVALAILFTNSASADEFQKYGENPTDWKLFTKEKGEVTKVRLGNKFSGNGMKTGYKLDMLPLNKGATVIFWTMSFEEFYAFYIDVSTTKGQRILRYTSLDKDIGKKGKYISFGLGSSTLSAIHNEQRDVQKDLNKFEQGNKVLSINSFMVRGSGVVGSLQTRHAIKPIVENINVMIEDAEANHDSHWSVFTSSKGTITTDSDAIKLTGQGMKTGYKLSFPILDNELKAISWDMKYSENYAIYFLVNTSNGVKYLRYSALDYDKGIHSRYISFGLGANSKDGKWHSFKRNLQKDLNKFEPNSKIISINAFMIRGSGFIDNIKAIKDSSISTIKNFNTENFNSLLKQRVDNYYEGNSATIDDTGYERVKYINFFDITGDNYHLTLYTLSSDQTQLRELASYYGGMNTAVGIENIRFNSDHTKMNFTVSYNDHGDEEKVEDEISL